MNYNNKQDEITWESIGDELLFRKNKFEFTKEEKTLIKKLLPLLLCLIELMGILFSMNGFEGVL